MLNVNERFYNYSRYLNTMIVKNQSFSVFVPQWQYFLLGCEATMNTKQVNNKSVVVFIHGIKGSF